MMDNLKTRIFNSDFEMYNKIFEFTEAGDVENIIKALMAIKNLGILSAAIAHVNYSMSLNKFIKDNNNYNTDYSSSNENILNTNHNFYRKQSNLLDKYRTKNNPIDINYSLNLYNDKSFKFFEKDNFSSLYDRNKEFINIEDLLNLNIILLMNALNY
jgi:hypothetical protein